MKNAISEIKIQLDKINRRLETAERKINVLRDTPTVSIKTETFTQR